MNKPLILAIDQGTHASKALLFNMEGQLIKSSVREIGLFRGANGVVEQDAEEIVASVAEAVEEVLFSVHEEVQCAGLAVQRSTVVAWDIHGKNALAPAISWQDVRTRRNLKKYESNSELIRKKTGLRLSPHYGASKLAWLLSNSPSAASAFKNKSLAFGPLESWLIFRLLEKNPLIVNHCCAARTLLWNLTAQDWDPWLLDLFEIPKHCLPMCVPVRRNHGILKGSGIPLTASNGDQNAALFRCGYPDAKTAYVNLGTGAFVLALAENQTGEPPKAHPKLLTGPIDGALEKTRFALEGTVNGAGSAISWLQEKAYAETTGPTENIPIFINTVGGLGSPWWVSGVEPFFVEDKNCAPGDRLASVEESIAFMLKANLDEMTKTGIHFDKIQATGGLSQANRLCQTLSDLSELPVLRSSQPEATARGIAWLASGTEKPWKETTTKTFHPTKNTQLRMRFSKFIETVKELKPQ